MKITQEMEMPGPTSLTPKPDPEHIDGVRMVLPVFRIITSDFALLWPFGMGKIPFLRSVCSE